MSDEIERVALAINGPHDSTHIGKEELLRLQKVRWEMTPSFEKQNCLTQARAVTEAMQPIKDRPITQQEAAKVLLEPDSNGGRGAVYDACEKRVKVYKFDAVLRAIAGEDLT